MPVISHHSLHGVLTAARPELGQRSRKLLRIFLLMKPAFGDSFRSDIWVSLEKVRAHWLVLFGCLFHFLELLPEIVETWLGPKQPRVLPNVGSTHVTFRLGVTL